MKIKQVRTETGFKPIKLELELETMSELLTLWNLTLLDDEQVAAISGQHGNMKLEACEIQGTGAFHNLLDKILFSKDLRGEHAVRDVVNHFQENDLD